jgi:hypothetical protein
MCADSTLKEPNVVEVGGNNLGVPISNSHMGLSTGLRAGVEDAIDAAATEAYQANIQAYQADMQDHAQYAAAVEVAEKHMQLPKATHNDPVEPSANQPPNILSQLTFYLAIFGAVSFGAAFYAVVYFARVHFTTSRRSTARTRKTPMANSAKNTRTDVNVFARPASVSAVDPPLHIAHAQSNWYRGSPPGSPLLLPKVQSNDLPTVNPTTAKLKPANSSVLR